MSNFNKAYNLKIISFAICISFLFTNAVYPYCSNRDYLRLPAGEERTFNRLQVSQGHNTVRQIIRIKPGTALKYGLVALYTIMTAMILTAKAPTGESREVLGHSNMQTLKLQAPRLEKIPEISIDGNYKIGWHIVKDAEIYEIWESEDPYFKQFRFCLTKTNSIDVAGKNKGDFYYKIRPWGTASDNTIEKGEWSDVITVSVSRINEGYLTNRGIRITPTNYELTIESKVFGNMKVEMQWSQKTHKRIERESGLRTFNSRGGDGMTLALYREFVSKGFAPNQVGIKLFTTDDNALLQRGSFLSLNGHWNHPSVRLREDVILSNSLGVNFGCFGVARQRADDPDTPLQFFTQIDHDLRLLKERGIFLLNAGIRSHLTLTLSDPTPTSIGYAIARSGIDNWGIAPGFALSFNIIPITLGLNWEYGYEQYNPDKYFFFMDGRRQNWLGLNLGYELGTNKALALFGALNDVWGKEFERKGTTLGTGININGYFANALWFYNRLDQLNTYALSLGRKFGNEGELHIDWTREPASFRTLTNNAFRIGLSWKLDRKERRPFTYSEYRNFATRNEGPFDVPTDYNKNLSFKDAIAHLNTPYKIFRFTGANIGWAEYEKGHYREEDYLIISPQEVYENRAAVCSIQTLFQCYLLTLNGYKEVYNLFDRHVHTMFEDEEGNLILSLYGTTLKLKVDPNLTLQEKIIAFENSKFGQGNWHHLSIHKLSDPIHPDDPDYTYETAGGHSFDDVFPFREEDWWSSDGKEPSSLTGELLTESGMKLYIEEEPLSSKPDVVRPAENWNGPIDKKAYSEEIIINEILKKLKLKSRPKQSIEIENTSKVIPSGLKSQIPSIGLQNGL